MESETAARPKNSNSVVSRASVFGPRKRAFFIGCGHDVGAFPPITAGIYAPCAVCSNVHLSSSGGGLLHSASEALGPLGALFFCSRISLYVLLTAGVFVAAEDYSPCPDWELRPRLAC